jgi:hypothetical protein
MITTTLNRIRNNTPCHAGWRKLLASLGKTQADSDPLPFTTIIASIGLDDAIWCCRAELQYAREWRLYAVWCARRVQHLLIHPASKEAISCAERYANGEIPEADLVAARWAARDVAFTGREETIFPAKVRAFTYAQDAAWATTIASPSEAASSAAAWSGARAVWDGPAAQAVEFLRLVTETEARP